MVEPVESAETTPGAMFLDLLARWKAEPSVGTDDLVAAILPLMQQVRRLHDQGRVAPLDGVDRLRLAEGRELWFAASDGRDAITDPVRIAAIERPPSEGIEITGQVRVVEAGDGVTWDDTTIAARGAEILQPVYCLDYTTWEMAAGHHDALADIFALGMLMASLAARLDFTVREELQRFIAVRRNVQRLNTRIHPVVARLISHMTELRRASRAQDLTAIIDTFEHYLRAETDDFEERIEDLARIDDPAARRRATQDYLRNRLFEISRRNRLVYFKETAGSANLTLGSLPYTLDYRAIRAWQLLVGGERLVSLLDKHHERESWLPLQQHLRFTDYPFLAPTLDKIRLQARSDQKEYGLSQLRLVVAFLRWNNLARDRDERISSPLVLLPVEMRKQPGSDHGYDLLPLASPREAEINPVLRHHLRDAFGIELPETIDLTATEALAELGATLEAAIGRRHSGVTVSLVTKPRIQLIHRTVRRQIEDFNRRRRKTGHGQKDYGGLSYSYEPDIYAPLGLQIFNRSVRTTPAPGREMIGQTAQAAAASRTGEREASRDFYALDQGANADPLSWEIDLTEVTLSNFNYRKMSLVRDYSELRSGRAASHVNFDNLFSSSIRPEMPETSSVPHAERFMVMQSDPSQDGAVLAARGGFSYVIQGPPGTGKSQTIANLLADFAARGRKVLFVCEKRVALDVVHHRLTEAGLADLTCLVHDAREDRKEVIAELKRLYETWRQAASRSVAEKRRQCLEEIDAMLAELAAFSNAMTSPPRGEAEALRTLIGHAIRRDAAPLPLDRAARDALPPWRDMTAARPGLASLEELAARHLPGGMPVHAFVRHLRSDLGRRDDPSRHLTAALAEAGAALDALRRVGGLALGLAPGSEAGIGTLRAQCALAAKLRPLAASDSLAVLDALSPERARLDDAIARLDRRAAELDAAERTNPGWKTRLTPAETAAALAVARNREGSILSLFYGDWRRLKARLAECHPAPIVSYTALLEQLSAEHAARAAHLAEATALADRHGHADLTALQALLADADRLRASPSSPEAAVVAAVVASPPTSARGILALASEAASVERAVAHLDAIFEGYAAETPSRLAERIRELGANADAAADILPRLARIEETAPDLVGAWRRLGLGVADLERATLHESITRAFRADPATASFDAARLSELSTRLGKALSDLRTLNGRHILAECRSRFRQRIAAAQATARSGVDMGVVYREGCRVLEHQFGLTRPSKSLREMLTGDPGQVLRDLKPIWMMSPLSVADTLPFSDDLFDAVIFDEASQIPLEDAVPALYRARQTIIVGDEMQLPPTSFFSSSSNEGDDEPLPDYLAYAVSADSLLTKAAGTLASTRLAWHYRSRHESLISFCNRAFYGGDLNTVPSVKGLQSMPAIAISDVEKGLPAEAALAASVLERPISAHRIEGGAYRNQQNEAEAGYVAALVRALLKKRAGRSIGVVAFSQPQAEAITAAIDRLAADDRKFSDQLETERERMVDGQFAGLFVKNLESVQGDERDIVIVSVGYAPGADGRMRMNFGPINQSGGEKRLNVIFSRARHHVAIVSSIGSEAITNDYNLGANTLKQYLRYAAAVSTGSEAEIRAALETVGVNRGDDGRHRDEIDPLALKLAERHAAGGAEVAVEVGHSTLTVDVAVRDPATPGKARALLLDTERNYAIPDLVERYVTRPGVFRAFGWDVEHVLAKDHLPALPAANSPPPGKVDRAS
jgi:hypothetical protein